MKKITAGIISIGLCTTLLVGGMKAANQVAAEDEAPLETVTINTEELEKQTADPKTDGTEELGLNADNLLSSLLSVNEKDQKPEMTTKEETVYIVADANGKEKKVIVSDWIKNVDKKDQLKDKTVLKDILNVKGDEAFTQNGENGTWDAKGNDISYQGVTDKEVPIKVKVTYQLDGKTMTPEEIKGKSGHVVMRFDYENNATETVEIGGKKEEIKVPFLMLTGVLLKDSKFTNVTASNAKLINDGSRTVVIGISLPGFQEGLNIDRSKLEIPDHLEISADVVDFGLSMTLTVATSEIFGRLNGLDVTSLDSLSESMAELTGAMSQLMNGSETLSNGLLQLLEKSEALETGVGQLADGAVQLADGVKSADDGVAKLKDGADKLSSGAEQLDGGIGSLKDGAGQLAGGTKELSDGAGKLADGTAALSDGAGQLVTGTAALSDGAGQLVTGTAALSDGAGQLVTGTAALSDGADKLAAGTKELSDGAGKLKDGIDQVNTGAASLSTGAGQLKDGLDTLTGNNAALLAGAEQVFKTMLATAETQLKEAGAEVTALTIENYGKVLEGVAGQLKQGAKALEKADAATAAIYKEKAKAVETLKASLDAYNTFYAGLKSYTSGVEQAAQGAGQIVTGANALATGTGALKDGADALKTGADTINTGMAGLKSGADQVNTGAASLKAGADQLNTGLGSLKTGADQVNTGAQSLKTGIDQVNTGASGLKTGADQVNTGAASLKSGADQLKTGSESLKSGAAELATGVGTLKDGTGALLTGAETLSNGLGELNGNIPALKQGVTLLSNGAVLLKDGIKEFNDRGISKITEAVEGDLEGLLERVRAMGTAASQYRNFSGLSDDMDGQVKFIFRTDEI